MGEVTRSLMVTFPLTVGKINLIFAIFDLFIGSKCLEIQGCRKDNSSLNIDYND
jgi:hypothetical protein